MAHQVFSFARPPQPICGKRGCSQKCEECFTTREARLEREMAQKGVAIPYTKVKHPQKPPLTFKQQIETLSHTRLRDQRALPWSPYKGLPIVKESDGRSSFGKWGRTRKASRKAYDVFTTPRTNPQLDCIDKGFLLAQEIGEGSTAKVRIAQVSFERKKAMKQELNIDDNLVRMAQKYSRRLKTTLLCLVRAFQVAIKITKKNKKTKDFVLFKQEKECKAMFKVGYHPNVVSAFVQLEIVERRTKPQISWHCYRFNSSRTSSRPSTSTSRWSTATSAISSTSS